MKNISSKYFHIICCATYAVLCIAWRLFAGRPWTWDQMHYHAYVAHAWWTGRLPEELFAAGAQSYLNPLPHLPFYMVLQTGLPGLAVPIFMGVFHGINLWLLHFIACKLIPPADRMRRLLVVCGVVLGAFSPGFLFEVGTSYADVVVSIPAMGAMLLLLGALSRKTAGRLDWRWVSLAAFIAGGAVGLKPTAATFCGVLFLVFLVMSGRQAWHLGWRAVLAGMLGLGSTGGAHAWMLWKAFGNPVFPLFNGVFRSPWFPEVNVVSHRFIPASWEDALRFPLEMANSLRRVSFEEQIVDSRPLGVLILLACVALWLLVKRMRGMPPAERQSSAPAFLSLVLVLYIPLWIATSGNIRYATEALLLLGPLIALLAWQFNGKSHVGVLLAILLPLFAQSVVTFTINSSSRPEFDWGVWRPQFFYLSVPEPLNKQPAYYWSLQPQGFGSFIQRFPSGARFLNLGLVKPGKDSLVLAAVEKDRQSKGLPLRSLYNPSWISGDKEKLPFEHINIQNALLSEYGYKVKEDDCLFFGWLDPNERIQKQGFDSLDNVVFVSCAIVPAEPLPNHEVQRRKKIDARIDAWVLRCPHLFYPDGFWSTQFPLVRKRYFLGPDLEIVQIKTGELWARHWRDGSPFIYLENEVGEPLVEGCPQRPLN